MNADQPAPRVAKRLKVFLPATLMRGGAEVRVHILDISTTGALVHATSAIPANAIVLLCRDGLSLSGTVRWSAGQRFGIAFDSVIPEHQIARMLSAK